MQPPRLVWTVGRLHERTEGWIAGLFLAALSLHDRGDAGAFVADFAGDDRHVADYLCAEISRARLPLARVLLRTAILDRFCPRLCAASRAPVVEHACWPRSSARASCRAAGLAP